MCAAVCLAAALLAGCGSRDVPGVQGGEYGAGGGRPEKAGMGLRADGSEERHLRVALFWVSATLDPADGYNGWVVSRIGAGETLLRLDENAQLQGCIAESWEQQDENTWIFHIREGITFSNGKAVDAWACKRAVERAFERNDRAREYFLLDSIKANGQELILKTAKPSGAVPNNLCEPLFTIVDTEVEEEETDRAPVCTGPYVVQAFSPEASVELVKNETYWDGPVGLDRISVRQAADSDSRVMAMQSGEADLTTTIDNMNLALFWEDERYSVYEAIGPRTNVVYMNNRTGFLKDPVLRQALSYGTDRETYAKLIRAEKAVGLYSTALVCGRGLNDPYGWNPEKAMKLLDEHGYVDRDGDGIREKDGQRIVLRYYLSADHGSSDAALIAQAVQADAARLGIGVELLQSENLAEIKSRHLFDLCSANDSTAPTADPEIFLTLHYLSGASANYGEYANREVDDGIRKLQTVFDAKERQELARDISQRILDDAACLYIGYIYGNTVASSRVKQVRQFPIDYYIITKDITIQ